MCKYANWSMCKCANWSMCSMAAGRSDLCSVALVVLVAFFQLLLFKCYQPMGNNHNPTRKLTENFHASTWRLFKPAPCIAKDVKFRKQTTRKFNNFNGYIAGLLLVCGDISSHPGPDGRGETIHGTKHPYFQLNEKGLKLCHLNVRSLPRHFEEIKMLMLMNDFDLFAMSETWLSSTWTDPELAIDNYTIYRYDRNDAKGGGVAIYIKKTRLFVDELIFSTKNQALNMYASR